MTMQFVRTFLIVLALSAMTWVVLGVIPSVLIAMARGTDASMALLWGFLLGPFGAIVVAFSRSGMRECPECTKDAPKKARRCPHCQAKLKPPDDDD